LAKAAGTGNLITFDMGGTTAKASMIENGEVLHTSEYEVGAGINLSNQLVKGGGYALKLPVIDVSEIGAGGGSIVWVDQGGSLRVGPHSAGALPGPACYGAGGELPTVTDANLQLGYLNPAGLADGRISLDQDAARISFEREIVTALGLSTIETAFGVYTIAATNMIRAIKAVSTYRGRDPRDFSLLAFGGNGPVFAVEIARMLQMTRVLVPPAAGVFSAFGLLTAAIEQQLVQTYFRPAAEIDVNALTAQFMRLEDRATEALLGEGIERERIALRRSADLRYAGQAYELTVPAPEGPLSPADIDDLVEAFGEEHLRTYGHRTRGEPVDLVNLRVSARVAAEDHGFPRFRETRPASGERMAYFGPSYGFIVTPVLARADLASRRRGPLIVEETDSTTVVPPGASAMLDELGNIAIEVES
jgi:N-methylhydantoinase A